MLAALVIPIEGQWPTFRVWIYDLDKPRATKSPDPQHWYTPVRCEGTYSNRRAAEEVKKRFSPLSRPD